MEPDPKRNSNSNSDFSGSGYKPKNEPTGQFKPIADPADDPELMLQFSEVRNAISGFDYAEENQWSGPGMAPPSQQPPPPITNPIDPNWANPGRGAQQRRRPSRGQQAKNPNDSINRILLALVAVLSLSIIWLWVDKPWSDVEQVQGEQLAGPVVGNELAPVQAAAVSENIQRSEAALQSEINRLVAGTPVIFAPNQTELSGLNIQVLNNVASMMKAYPGLKVEVVGTTDQAGSTEINQALSLGRSEKVKQYLVSQGVAGETLIPKAAGEQQAGDGSVAALERKVEFRVVVAAAPAGSGKVFRVAIVAPSARNDLAFSQSMFDAANALAAEHGNVEVDIADGLFVPQDAESAVRGYAEQGYDLIIAHGSEYANFLKPVATEFPQTTFAVGTLSDNFGLSNVYAYDVAAEQGGYVMGAMSTSLTKGNTLGVVGPIEVGDAKRYVDGYVAGAKAEKPTVNVKVSYINSFSDSTLAATAAKGHTSEGADVITGTGEMVVGAVAVAESSNALWFGTQANQTAMSPNIVVASQVYHWEVLLRQIVAEVESGKPNGRALVADLANGGIVIEYNDNYALPAPIKARGQQLAQQLKDGSLKVPGSKPVTAEN